MKHGHALWCAALQTSLHPPYIHTEKKKLLSNKTPSAFFMRADLSPVDGTPTVSYRLLFLFKHHLRLCVSSSPPTPISSTMSHHILVNTIRHKIIFNHSDLSLIQVLSRMVCRRRGAWLVASGVKVLGVCALNAWRQHACSITPSVTFCFIYQTDSEARLAMRHVGLCTLQRWTNRADRSVMLGYQGAWVLSKHCFIRLWTPPDCH